MEKPRRNWGLVVWVMCVLVAVFVLTAIAAAWSVRHAMARGHHFSPKQREFVLLMADFPGLARDAIIEATGLLTRRSGLEKDRSAVEKPYWVRRFPAPQDPGYVLFSGPDGTQRGNVVKLIRISDGKTLAEWIPDWKTISARTSNKRRLSNMQAIHPLTLPGGDIVFNTLFSMVRLSPCSADPVWVLDEVIHHSNEIDGDGMIWTGGLSTDGFKDNEYLQERIRDDAILRVSPDGKVLQRYSISKMLRDNGLESLLMGTHGETLQIDPIHLNQVRRAESDTKFWKRGDLLVSMRHLSLVLLYRPSTGKIVWHQLGPWMNQHDADFLDDHRISIFDNNVYSGSPEDQPFMVKGDSNRVFVYDFATGEASQPFAAQLSQAKPATVFEGRARILPDGGLFVEESGQGRLLRFTRDGLLWSFVNDVGPEKVGVLSWSRYLTAEEAAPVLKDLAARQCPAGAPPALQK